MTLYSQGQRKLRKNNSISDISTKLEDKKEIREVLTALGSNYWVSVVWKTMS